jgi:putative ABC transport system permease protein
MLWQKACRPVSIRLDRADPRPTWLLTPAKGAIMRVRSAIRSLARMPSFPLAVVLTIALGVGATTAMFSVVCAVLLRPLPYPNADRIVVVWERWQVDRDMKGVDPVVAARLAERSVVMTDALSAWRTGNHVFQQIGGFNPRQFSLTGTAEPERVEGIVASSDFFRVLDTHPSLGRAFSVEEDQPGRDEVVILGHGLWMRRFGGDRTILGRTIGVDGLPHTVIGVMPADFHLVLPNAPADPQLITPVPHSYQPGRKWALLMTVARLKPGVDVAAAQSDMSAVVRRMAATNRRYATRGANVVPLAEEMAQNSRLALLVLFGATGGVLLIGCVNVANLLLVRVAARQKEFAIRTALGAGRWQIIRDVLGESLALAAVGGACGLLLAYWGTDALLALVPEHLFPRLEEVKVDRTVLGFGLVVSLLVGLAAGLAPALHALGRDRHATLNRALNAAQRTSTLSRRQRATRRILVATQVAIAMVMLVGAALLTQTYVRLTRVDLGVSPQHVLTFGVILPPARYGTDVGRMAFEDKLLSKLEVLPGVEGVGLTNSLPVQSSFTGSMNVTVEGRAPVDGEFVDVRTVNPGFFRAAGARLAYGRFLNAGDARSEVTVVNRALIRRYWPSVATTGPEPLGRRLQLGDRWCTIIGVVDDIKYSGPDRRSEPEAYAPLAFWPTGYLAGLVRVAGDPMAIAGLARQGRCVPSIRTCPCRT